MNDSREGDSCEQCIKLPGCSIHGNCIKTQGTPDTNDDVLEALTCHCTDTENWTGSLCDQGKMYVICAFPLLLRRSYFLCTMYTAV